MSKRDQNKDDEENERPHIAEEKEDYLVGLNDEKEPSEKIASGNNVGDLLELNNSPRQSKYGSRKDQPKTSY
jgi:hypothetical protein